MSTNTDIAIKTSNSAAGLCFFILAAIWGAAFFIPESLILAIPLLMGGAVLFFIYFLASEGYLPGILTGIITSVVLMAVAALIPVIGWLVLMAWIFYNIAKALESIKSLFPEAMISIALAASLLIPALYDLNTYGEQNLPLKIICGIVYFAAAIICCARINARSSDTKHGLFLFSMMLLSVPMILLLLVSIVSALRTAFRMCMVQTTSIVKAPQQVSGYVRDNGTVVKGYERMIDVKVTSPTTLIPPNVSVGAVNASLAADLSAANTLASRGNSSSALSDSRDKYISNADQHFYRYDNLDDKKVGNFIRAVNEAGTFPALRKDDIIIYFDETVMGKGDRGVVLTDDAIYCLPGMFERNLHVLFADIADVSMKGSLNKHITLQLHSGEKRSIALTQSNKGAEKVFELIQRAI